MKRETGIEDWESMSGCDDREILWSEKRLLRCRVEEWVEVGWGRVKDSED